MDRFWLITWTCYGTRLPGDEHGFVGNIRVDGEQLTHNILGTPFDANMPRLEAWVKDQMKGPPVTLGTPEALAMIAQYQETAQIKKWGLLAASVMYNHTHIVVGVPGDPDPQSILETFKSWATRSIKKIRPIPPNGTFWTANGSKRKLPDADAVRGGVIYVVKKQPDPLAVWFASDWQEVLDAFERMKSQETASRAP